MSVQQKGLEFLLSHRAKSVEVLVLCLDKGFSMLDYLSAKTVHGLNCLAWLIILADTY